MIIIIEEGRCKDKSYKYTCFFNRMKRRRERENERKRERERERNKNPQLQCGKIAFASHMKHTPRREVCDSI